MYEDALKILIPLIKSSEGCKLTAYADCVGVWTIGYGCTGADIKKGVTWTQAQAEAELDILAHDVIRQACKASPNLTTPSRQAAIGDFIYNLGIGNYSKSTLKKYVDQNNWLAASGEITKWNKAGGVALKGLTVRRKKESDLLLK